VEQTTERLTVERTIEIEASPETVWELLTDPAKAGRWWGLGATFDPRPGGEFRLAISPRRIVSGEFVELDPPHRLVYTFGWELDGSDFTPPGSTTVEITLEPSGGVTLLTLVHSGLTRQDTAESHGEGWAHYLSRLAIAAAGGDPGPDPWAQAS
jgi:uncharacterized protein YndB with AHSA1/START domain